MCYYACFVLIIGRSLRKGQLMRQPASLLSFLTGTLNSIAWMYVFLPCVFIGGVILTVRSGAIQFDRFGYVMKNTLGVMFKKREAGKGAVTPLQAVSTALASTVGTGNIVGTSQAIAMGGYGAVFWLWIAALLSMAIKYSEVTLSIRFRQRDERGDWVGGPMYYITNGMGRRWRVLAVIYAALACLACFGIGNMSQVNSFVCSVIEAVESFRPVSEEASCIIKWGVGIALALTVAMILLGGIKRIGSVTEKLVPLMSILYIGMTLIVLICHAQNIGWAFAQIVKSAFAPRAVIGAGSGIALKEAVVWGLRRSAFSNEAGLGSAGIAHAAADTDSPVGQGLFGIFEVFADTVVICTMTAMVIICSRIPVEWGVIPGSSLVVSAFSTVFGGRIAAVFVAGSLALFAFSTVLGWALYGTRCAQYIFGTKAIRPYQLIFAAMIVVGCVSPIEIVWDIADTLNGLMAIPNFIALFSLTGVVARLTEEHFSGIRGNK